MKTLITVLLLAVIAFSTLAISFAGDRFGRNFEKAFGTTLGIGAAIIVIDVVNQAINPRCYSPLYYEHAPVVYTAPEYYDSYDRHSGKGYRDSYGGGFNDGYDEGYYDGYSQYYRNY